MTGIIGQDAALGTLNADCALGRIAHTYLFVGGEGLGKRTLAERLAHTLSGAGNVIMLAPGENGGIGVDAVRGLIAQLNVKPFAGGRHVAVIDHAETLTIQAQNALLKVLESPPGDAVLFICTQSAEKMLGTMVSRARVVRFLPINLEDFCTILNLPCDDAASDLHALSGGSPGVAAQYMSMKDYPAVAKTCRTLIEDKHDAYDLPRLVKPLLNADHRAVLNIIEAALSTRTNFDPRAARSLIQARKEDAAHVAWRSVLERLFSGDSVPAPLLKG